jgi:NAD+ synthase
MSDELKIALAQLNPTVGDIAGNSEIVRDAHAKAAALGADVVAFSELFLIGYPPEDLVLKPAFQSAAEDAVRNLAILTKDGGPAILLGTSWRDSGKLYNAVAYLDEGQIKDVRFKADLPNYGVFDEKRVFAAAAPQSPINMRGVLVGVPICEDAWSPDAVETMEECGAEIIFVINGSPFEADKFDERLSHIVARITESNLPFAYLNQVGGQDELVFDGGSFILNADKKLALQMPMFEDAITLSTWHKNTDHRWFCDAGEVSKSDDGLSAVYRTMVLGLRDYVNKNRFPGVVLGLSGGVDSALSAAVAVDALGADRVWCIKLPSEYTSEHSNVDADDCAEFLGVRLDEVAIAPAVNAFEGMLAHIFKDREADITEENIQSRSRGLALMAISNKFGHMVLTTGNKSEMSVGYATIYGDMCGGYSVLKDVYKTMVFDLCHWRNPNIPNDVLGTEGRVIPENTIVKPPTAELRPDQKDEDSLPPYDQLDDILESLVEQELTVAEVIARGHDADLVKRIQHLLYVAEYKRRQAPPGVKITRRNFGRDRRYPITNGFRDS